MPAIRILCDGEVIEAELLVDDAPRVCGYIRSILPFESTMVHAKFAGEETIVMVPFFAEQEIAYGVSQTFELGGKRRKRINAANAASSWSRTNRWSRSRSEKALWRGSSATRLRN